MSDPENDAAENETRPDLMWDDEERGLCIRGYSDGSQSFIFVYRIGDRQRFLRIGRSPDWSLKAARTRAKELRSIVDQGRDPAADQGDRRGIATVERFLRYISEASWDHGTTKEPEKRNHLIGWRGVGQIYSGDPTLRERAGDATLFSGGASVVALPAAIRLIDETPPLVLTG